MSNFLSPLLFFAQSLSIPIDDERDPDIFAAVLPRGSGDAEGDMTGAMFLACPPYLYTFGG